MRRMGQRSPRESKGSKLECRWEANGKKEKNEKKQRNQFKCTINKTIGSDPTEWAIVCPSQKKRLIEGKTGFPLCKSMRGINNLSASLRRCTSKCLVSSDHDLPNPFHARWNVPVSTTICLHSSDPPWRRGLT
jgi:hypothetical protein